MIATTRLLAACALATSYAASFNATAQTWPTKPIRLVLGPGPDTIARLVGQKLGDALGQPIIVEQRGGGGGTMSGDAVAKAPPDGYTLLLVTGGHAVAGATYNKLPYDTVASFQMLSLATEFAFLLTGRADSPMATMQSIIEAARAKPDAVSYGSAGIGATQHLIGELLATMIGAKLLHVPYKGDAGAVTGVLSGEVNFMVAPPTALIGQIRAGKMKAYATTGNTRWPRLPEVPTIEEAGVAGFDVRSWAGLATTAGTPRPIADRLNAEINRALQVDTIRSRLEELGGELRGTTPEQMRDRIASDLARWNKVMDSAKIPRQ